jgi:hypothetical protein
VVVIVAIIASQNDEDCSKRKCDAGLTPRLIHHECLCVGMPK